jgi:predicted metal-dependent phosphoesterase TrpH
MRLKTNLHLHSCEDAYDVLEYSIFEAIDRAKELGYEVLAWTPHRQVLCLQEHIDYAQKRGILLLPGIEAKVEGREVLIINCGKEVEGIKTFSQLREYKKQKEGGVLIIAPHPFFPAKSVLAEKLMENIDLFDAIEKSWFYTKKVDFNRKAVKISQATGKPLIATSDTHRLSCLEKSYALVQSEKNATSFIAAVRDGRIDNFSRPISLVYAILFLLWLDHRPKALWCKAKKVIKRIFNGDID